jgi:Holliday junction DNA helicase RuvB
MTSFIPQETQEESKHLDSALRPDNFNDYVGQEVIKKNLKILLTAATERDTPPEHILLYGPPGLGKTTLAHLVAKELGANLKSIERACDYESW